MLARLFASRTVTKIVYFLEKMINRQTQADILTDKHSDGHRGMRRAK